jgi:diaminopimelate epimerase
MPADALRGQPFTKMHGLGNDFVVLDGVGNAVALDSAAARGLADRRRGVGCDQVLVVEPASDAGADFAMRVFNSDGSEVEHCGNGARCVARWLRDTGLATGDRVTLSTAGTTLTTRLHANRRVSIAMGEPDFSPAAIPLEADAAADSHDIVVAGEPHAVGAVSMGNPHAVLRYPDADAAPLQRLGPLIEHHGRFPSGANVGFMTVRDRGGVRLRVWERGAGETAACGTAACAAVAVGRRCGLLDERVTVALDGGELVIEWAGPDNPLWMTGPTATVFHGTIAP